MPITFLLQSKKKPAAIYVRFREGLTDAKARTRFTVNPEDWSHAKGKPKENDASGKMLNSELNRFRSELTDAINKRKPGEQVTTEWLKRVINPTLSKNSLLSYFEHYIEEKQKQVLEGKVTAGTVKKIEVNRKMLQRMGEDISIQDVNQGFINRFKDFCKAKGYAQNTIARCVKYIVTVCRDARKNGIIAHQELDHIKEKTIRVPNIYLTLEELSTIEDAKMETRYMKAHRTNQLPEGSRKPTMEVDYLDNARDWLLISCFTGQRISDFMRFTKEMVHQEKGKTVLEFTQVKTKKVMTIPLHPKIQAILDKRGGNFPRAIEDKNYNEFIKEVCQCAGITEKVTGSKKDPKTHRKESGTFEKWELVSSHIGRRSFASNFFGEIPVSLLMFVTGHTTESQFYAYIGKSERTKAFQLADYW